MSILPLLVLLSATVNDPGEAIDQAFRASVEGRLEEARRLVDRVIKESPEVPAAWYVRGRVRFQTGDVRGSLADFDQYVKLRPEVESRQWERGISCYYAGEFQRGAKQFELYQTYHNADVENAVWRYLCVARAEGRDAAIASLLPIENDRRVPLMEIYRLYEGKAKPEEVLAAARAGEPEKGELSRRLFYAHLYIGLWLEVAGEAEAARPHLELAAGEHRLDHYMGDVARIHWELRKPAARDR